LLHMQSHPPEIHTTSRFALLRSALWSHRWGAFLWALATGAFVLYFGVGYRASILSFKGGAAAFGLAATPVAQAMRPLSGPAERLDTYGGYVTYHNTSVIALLLSLWAVIQGARAIRGWEERGSLEVWLATARRRWTVVRDQSLAFLTALSFITLGYALGLGSGAAIAGAPNWGGALVVAAETAVVAAFFFGAGLLISQLVVTARAAAGITILAMVLAYVLGNMADELGWFSWIRFVSPFFYFQQSRVLVPGHHLDAVATFVLAFAAVALTVVGASALSRRDLGASFLSHPRQRPAQSRDSSSLVRIGGFWVRDAWLRDLHERWLNLAIWALASGLLMALMVATIRNVTGVWENSALIKQLFGRLPGQTFVEQYLAYVGIIAAVAPAAYAVSEAARWVSDLDEGRAGALLAVYGSRVRLILEWGASVLVGVATISLAVLAGGALGAAAAGVGLSPAGLLRTAAVGTLLGAGIGGIALASVVLSKSDLAVGGLAAWLGASFFVSLLGPLFGWPEWLMRLSPFDAFGTPYTRFPGTSSLIFLAGLAIVGTVVAAAVGQRRSALV